MQTASRGLSEARFTRNPALTGAELRVVNGQREWGFFSQSYQFLFSVNWRGQVWHRRREACFDSQHVVVATPYQMVVTKNAGPGFLVCLSVERSLMERLAELESSIFSSGGMVPVSVATAEALADFGRELSSTTCAETLEAYLREVLRPLIQWRQAPLATAIGTNGLHELESHLETDEHVAFDLQSLSEHLGLSRFSALRAFKRHFGLPPHNYQIHMRVDQAQTGLRAGRSPARVAIDCGFFDQSHLTRHFKKVLGTTPAQYARACLSHLAEAFPLAQPEA